MRVRSAQAALIGLGLGCAAAPQAEAPVVQQASPASAQSATPASLPPGAAQYEPAAECTRPNVDDADGTPACAHVTPADMLVKKDDGAPVQVVWKRRMSGNAVSRGWMQWSAGADGLRVKGKIEMTMQPYKPLETPLELDEVRLVMAHEFGHVLGLGHSLDEDSAMNYSWHTRDRIFVTDHDVQSFLALVNEPSGLRVDGTPLAGL